METMLEHTCLCAEIRNDIEGILAGVVHLDHLLSPNGRLLTLLHHLVLVSRRVDHGKKVRMDEVLQLVHHHEHDELRDNVADGLAHNGRVGVNQSTNGLHLPLQLRIH